MRNCVMDLQLSLHYRVKLANYMLQKLLDNDQLDTQMLYFTIRLL